MTKFKAIKQYLYKYLNTYLIRQYHIKVHTCNPLTLMITFFPEILDINSETGKDISNNGDE